MKRTIATAGLAALGAFTVQAGSSAGASAYAPGLEPVEKTKPWSIGLAVRGFYDDNYTTDCSRSSTP